MSNDQDTSDVEILIAVLESTRAQLGRSTSLVAELEGFLNVERRRTAALLDELKTLKKQTAEKSATDKAAKAS